MDIYGDMGVWNSLRKGNHILLELLNIIGTRGQMGEKMKKGTMVCSCMIYFVCKAFEHIK